MEKHFILGTKNYYTTYFIDNASRPTIIVSPGGGYAYTSPRESLPVAKIFNSYGYHVVIVNYLETKEAYPKPSEYLYYTIKELHGNQKVSHIIGLGFSAGGHNILEVALHKDVKFDLLILGYPVVTSNELYWHKASFENLLKENFNDLSLRNYLSLETQVTKNAPDLFLWGTYTDESVSLMNSILLLEAYNKNKVNAEYHLFPMGGHGLSVCNKDSAEDSLEKINPYVAKWIPLANEWIQYKLKNKN